MSQRVNVTSPVGRIVQGSLYEPNRTDAEGKPLVIKNGPNAGQPRVDYFFALAIPKGTEQHWAHTPWGQIIWQIGNQAFPHAAQAEGFAWKITDGDSQKPGKIFQGKPGKKPCENEGFPGHWVIKLSGGFAPKIYRQEGGGYVQITEKDFVKPGYYVEVNFSVEGNGSQNQPGVYLNHSMVCFRAYGQEIVFGPDVASAGFGASPLPAGASMTPPPSAMPMPAAPSMPSALTSAIPGLPMIPGAAPAPLPLAGSVPMPSAPVMAAPAPIPVTPNPAFLQVPAAPSLPPVPAAAPGRQMTVKANGIPYEQYIANGWTDATLVQNGYMTM